ncbi:MAG: hypothetical protein FWD13_12195 [Treponema sp.]|nr:hypothetical protein [Treponema sp.]
MDFYKVYGYACIYTFLNEIPITELTITYVESHHPRELIKHLESVRGYTVAKTIAGVYTVEGDIFPIQIIDSRELSAEDCVWLRNLGNKLKQSDVEQILIKIAQQGKSARIDAYAYAIAYANLKIMEDTYMTRKAPVDHEKRMEQFLRRAGLIDKWQAEERKEWQSVVADKDAEIARLRMQLESKK